MKLFRINTIPGIAAKEKGYAVYPDDFPHLELGKDFVAWNDGEVLEIETTLDGDDLFEKIVSLKTGNNINSEKKQ